MSQNVTINKQKMLYLYINVYISRQNDYFTDWLVNPARSWPRKDYKVNAKVSM